MFSPISFIRSILFLYSYSSNFTDLLRPPVLNSEFTWWLRVFQTQYCPKPSSGKFSSLGARSTHLPQKTDNDEKPKLKTSLVIFPQLSEKITHLGWLNGYNSERWYYNKPETTMLLYPLLTDTSTINAELHLTYLNTSALSLSFCCWTCVQYHEGGILQRLRWYGMDAFDFLNLFQKINQKFVWLCCTVSSSESREVFLAWKTT